ncbi:hypothetical protein DACRYDRAFT_103936 [Dacryopinax primogenitus]|uniref:Uncharacterized protein n=1 Tax=Dacryopinax primogenitus (strain DJM 731) TaxID=1858805 RepID=M5G5C0_DACPD|nr:uncharacterized protein DACRYDRAFT_103936 [Dacryopinax primogenitus]EJU05451.1 hypothetical protein DACRYDRAFT_103936 [Dacryopinax primogenitus]
MDDINPTEPLDRGYLLCFWKYAAPKAYGAFAFCECWLAEEAEKRLNSTEEETHSYWATGAELEETHIYQRIAQAYWRSGAALKTTLPLMKILNLGLPQAKKIGEHSVFGLQRGFDSFEDTLRYLADVEKVLAERYPRFDSRALVDEECAF